MEDMEQIAKEMDEQINAILTKQYSLIESGELTPALWCQEMMYENSISQAYSKNWLKEKKGLDVELLPEPELRMYITPAGATN